MLDQVSNYVSKQFIFRKNVNIAHLQNAATASALLLLMVGLWLKHVIMSVSEQSSESNTQPFHGLEYKTAEQ